MKKNLVLGVFKEGIDLFKGGVERSINKKFFEMDMSYDIVYLESINSISDAGLDVLFVDMSSLMLNINDRLENIFKNIKTYVVAIADSVDELLYAFKIKAFQAITKKSFEHDIPYIIDELTQEILHKDKIVVEDELEKNIVEVKDILYVEAIGDNSVIVTKTDSFFNKKPLKYWNQFLDDRMFFRCHKSYLIAVDKIDKIIDLNIYIRNVDNFTIPLAVRRKKNLKEILL